MNPIVDRIRTGLAKASAPAGTPEGETAAKIAFALLRAHATDNDLPTNQVLNLGARSVWRRTLINTIAQHCAVYVEAIISSAGVRLYGTETALAITAYLYEMLVQQVIVAADGNATRLPDHYGSGELKRIYNNYASSAVAALAKQLQEIREEDRKTDPTGTALVLDRMAAARALAKSLH